LQEFLEKKIVLISGPRQCGKTTLARSLLAEAKDVAYYNYDIKKDAGVFLRQEWDRTKKVVVFDELHKMKKWKGWLKGIYDAGDVQNQEVVVTGSSRLDITKKTGDSLAGRFFSFRLHPLDIKELIHNKFEQLSAEKLYQRLLNSSNFRTIYDGSEILNIWRKTHLDLIIRQDLLSLENIRDIEGVELLVELLSRRVGSIVSYNSLREDLGRDDKTIKRWIKVLENLFVIFPITTYSKNIARSLTKSTKFYFYDLGRIEGDESQKLENLVALSLKKS
jgi:hypothetical protein